MKIPQYMHGVESILSHYPQKHEGDVVKIHRLSAQFPHTHKIIQKKRQKVLDKPLTVCYYLLVGWLIRHIEVIRDEY